MSVQSEKLMEIVNEMELPVEEMAAFYKVSEGGRAVYIAKSKKVSRVDISGFDVKHPAIRHISAEEAKELKLGKVRAQIDFSKSEDRVIEALRTALSMMHHLAETPVDTTSATPTLAKTANKRNRKKAITKKAKARAAARRVPALEENQPGA